MSILLLFMTLFAFANSQRYDLYDEVKNSRNFTGKVALVTGSATGIGAEIIQLYSALGASVVVTGRKADDVHKTALIVQQLSPKHLKPLEITADLTKSDELENLLTETIKTYSKIDILVNNAGIYQKGNITDPKFLETLDRSIAIDIRANLQLIHLSVPYLQKTKGTVINLSDVQINRPQKDYLGYQIAKSSADMATQVLAIELGILGIRVNAVSPGIIESHPLDQGLYNKTVSHTPLGRVGQSADIAKAVIFLSSTDASFITGHNLVVDGGLKYGLDSQFLSDLNL
ncbi:uncharacterized protein LOC128960179 [Oppia nitens]|uniref:uncharacterized protein LOC128960179 n=1 Tax=Oppia nitens TaxID=1686743 RepID=UPI0023DC3172|nr:uncharacterized protein LOC128960179 [Oppia nitens]